MRRSPARERPSHHGLVGPTPIADLKWEQPHAVLWLTVNGVRQEVWLSPLQRKVDRGLQKEALTKGKTVTVEVQPHAKNANEWKALAITVDGKDVNLMR